jgi:hypothetical protein
MNDSFPSSGVASAGEPQYACASVADPAARIAGFHIYTFNELERTERWRRETLERLLRDDLDANTP